jgi:hypothetical protein
MMDTGDGGTAEQLMKQLTSRIVASCVGINAVPADCCRP